MHSITQNSIKKGFLAKKSLTFFFAGISLAAYFFCCPYEVLGAFNQETVSINMGSPPPFEEGVYYSAFATLYIGDNHMQDPAGTDKNLRLNVFLGDLLEGQFAFDPTMAGQTNIPLSLSYEPITKKYSFVVGPPSGQVTLQATDTILPDGFQFTHYFVRTYFADERRNGGPGTFFNYTGFTEADNIEVNGIQADEDPIIAYVNPQEIPEVSEGYDWLGTTDPIANPNLKVNGRMSYSQLLPNGITDTDSALIEMWIGGRFPEQEGNTIPEIPSGYIGIFFVLLSLFTLSLRRCFNVQPKPFK